MSGREHVAGVDLGATYLRAAVATLDGEIRGLTRRKTPQASGDEIADAIRETLVETVRSTGVDSDEISQVGVGSMGPLDYDGGAVVDPPNLPDAERVPVVDTVKSVVDVPVTLRNDATAGAIGVRFYAADAPSNLVYVTISTGLGVGAIVDDQPLVGATGNAAEVGHVSLDPDSPIICGCGGHGHWEAFCSGTNIPDYARHLARTEDIDTSLDLATLEAPRLFDAAPGDPLSTLVIKRFGEWNARGVSVLVHAYDPSLVVFGGGVAVNNPRAVVDPVREQLPEMILREPPSVRLTSLGSETVLRGAVAAAITSGAESGTATDSR